MDDDQQCVSNNQQDELQVQVYLKEYEKLREEVIQLINSQQQSVVLALGSASVALPLLIGQTANIPVTIIASLLYALAIIYAVIGMNYATSSYACGAISKYIHEYIEPEVNRIIKPPPSHKVLYWESFIRRERTNVLSLFLANIGSIGSILLLLLPGAASLLTAQYVLSLPTMQPAQQSTLLQVASFLLPPLSLITWCIYLLAIGSLILVTIYHAVRAKALVPD